MDIHHHWLGPAVPDVWKERWLSTGCHQQLQHPAQQADKGQGQCQLPGTLGLRGLRSQTQSSLSWEPQHGPPKPTNTEPTSPSPFLAVAAAAPSPRCYPLGGLRTCGRDAGWTQLLFPRTGLWPHARARSAASPSWGGVAESSPGMQPCVLAFGWTQALDSRSPRSWHCRGARMGVCRT